MSHPIVEMRSIDKNFGPVRALVDVHLTLMSGEVLGLVGDSSAYVGFTAGTGGLTAIQDLLSWTYMSTAPSVVPPG